MDAVVLCGLTLVTVLLAAMAGLIHAEVRDRRRALHRGGLSQPQAPGQACWAGSRPGSGTARGDGASRPAAAAGPGGDPWAPFTVRPDTGLDEIRREHYQHRRDLFSEREMAWLRFLRWLYRTGRVVP